MTRFFALLVFALFIVACGGPEGAEVESSEAVAEEPETGERTVAGAQFAVDPAQSVVNWEGTKLIGGGHTGTIPVTFGQLATAEGKLVGGRFTLDVRELKNTDLDDAEQAAKLEGHLKSADFFDVASHPNAEFAITSVQVRDSEEDNRTHDITGNLTLKGQSRSITIPATVSVEGDQLKASTPQFVIDRTEWGMEYGSGDIEGIAQDNIINDNVGLELVLVANKQ